LHLILVSHPPDSAAELARGLVEEGLAACVNIMPGSRSIYRWDDKTCEAEEVLLTIKTASEPIEELIETIARRHPHECPEVIVIPVTTGLDRYVQWVEKMSGKKETL
jgi:periplasmic divalent cation tolerance protein